MVKDPLRNRYFRFGEVERYVLEQLAADTSLEQVRASTEVRFGAVLEPSALEAFVRQLDEGGLLECPSRASDIVPSRGRGRRRSRLEGSLLRLRLPLLDPDRVVTELARRVRFLFTPTFVWLAAASILAAVLLVIANGTALVSASAGLLRLSTIPLVVVLLAVIITAHELAHAVTCKHFGGEVREVGFMLFYFRPAFYCNVSDAWLLPEKSQRVWVGLAGVFFELFLWSLATFAWVLTAGDSWINHIALAVMAISGVKSLVNLNPFIKLDGYYVLSDLLDAPNLRRKAFRYVGDAARRSLGIGARAAHSVSARDRSVLLVYGLGALAVSLSLLTYAYAAAGSFLIELRQPGALAVLTGFVGLRTNRYYRKVFGGRVGEADEDEPDGAPTSNGAAPAAPPRSGRPRVDASRRRRLLWLALAATMLAFVAFGRLPRRIPGPVGVLPQENADVRARVEGTIEEVLVDEGDRVRTGMVVARLSDRAMRAELAQNDAEIRESTATLRKLEAGPTPEETEVALAALERARDRLSFARARVARLETLFSTHSVPLQDVEDAREVATTSANDSSAARAALDVLLRGARREDIEATRARIDRLRVRRDHLTEQLEGLVVVSTASGVVATPARELMLLPGRVVAKGDPLVRVVNSDTVAAQIVVPEREIGDVRLGQRVELRLRAYPDVEFEGTVTTIAISAEGTAGGSAAQVAGASGSLARPPGRGFVVSSRFANGDGLIKPGMTGHAKILAGDRPVHELIVRRLFRTLKVEVWSWF